jgi:hypothetical protein
MVLFAISFLLVFLSSYLITSIISPKKSILGFIYLLLIAFAQLVLTFEILSLFSAIKTNWVIATNILFLLAGSYFWNKNNRPLWSLDVKEFRKKIINSLKLDMSLMWLYVGFLAFIISALILCLILPITNADAHGYHVARSLFWVAQGNLNHFEIADIRNLCLPINSEILYSWVFLLTKKDVFLCFFSFTGYLLSIVSIYNIMGYLKYCIRKRLWVIFILSSFASVIVQASGTETDIIISGLILSSMLLFWYALKAEKMTPVFMSSLAYALAIGTKTTALIAIPGVGLFFIALCIIYKKYKPLSWFLGFGLINFLIFASYNYILNFIQFSNFISSKSFMVASKNYYGIKGMAANFIRYIFMFFDFTGFTWSKYLGPHIINVRSEVLSFFHLSGIPDGLYTTKEVNNLLLEPIMGAGILGFLVYLPCLIWSFIKPVFRPKSKRSWIIFGFACLFIINLLSISYLIAYMSFSVRFIMSFMVLSSPILIYSYLSKRNPLKYIIIFFALFYFILVSTHIWPRPLNKIVKLLMLNNSIENIRYRALCQNYDKIPTYSNSECLLKEKIEHNYSKENKILAFMPTGTGMYHMKMLAFDGYKIDFARLENIKNIDLNKYNIIILPQEGQSSTVIQNYDKIKYEAIFHKNMPIPKQEELVSCFYLKNDKIPQIYKGKETYPYNVHCFITPNFITKNNLELIGQAGIVVLATEDFNYYKVYKNKNLPLKLIKK